MTHDLTHCDNTLCGKRLQCRRYIAHLDKIDRGLKGHFPYLIHDSKPLRGCDEYLPLNND